MHARAEQRAFFQYHAALQEPWDGPANLNFTDGRQIGALLDRNGLRPCRFLVTTDNRVLLASEVGVLPSIRPEQIRQNGRLAPGKMLLVDFASRSILDDASIKQGLAASLPYAKWVRENIFTLSGASTLSGRPPLAPKRGDERARLTAFGFTQESIDMLLLPMGDAHEAHGSMGNDAPLAVLSQRPHVVADYFHQGFSQVKRNDCACVSIFTNKTRASYR